MKIKVNDTDFYPFSLNLVFESKQEAEVFYAVFNYGPIVDVLEKRGIDCEKMRNAIKMKADTSGYFPIHQELCQMR